MKNIYNVSAYKAYIFVNYQYQNAALLYIIFNQNITLMFFV